MKPTLPLLTALLLAPLAELHAFGDANSVKTVGTIPELRQCLAASGQRVRMKPGVYRVTTADTDGKTVFNVSGSDNTFDLREVTLQVDTALLAKMKARTHELATYRILGHGNTFLGGTFENTGDHPPSTSLSEFLVSGDRNTFQGCTFIIRGSAPYGYGDLLGKGKGSTVSLQKHSAMGVTGDDTRIEKCRFFIHTFGHALHLHGAQKTLIQDTAIEGALRASDEILAEKKGPAFANDFKNIYGQRLPSGLMVCLAEDGIRAYLEGERDGKTRRTGDITVEGCSVKRMRGGITLDLASGQVSVRNCLVTESGYPGWAYSVPSKGTIRSSRGDAAYAPLLHLGYSHQKNADVELEWMGGPAPVGNERLALLNGQGHEVTLTAAADLPLTTNLIVACGETFRRDGEDVGKTFAKEITLNNRTRQPVLLTDLSAGCTVKSLGPVTDQGTGNRFTQAEK